MGRYYNGDIEGKFWFAVQSSDDADFFGSKGTACHLHYYFDEDHLDKVKEGIKNCKNTLSEYKEHLDNFFKTDGDKGYNEKMLVEYLNKNVIGNRNHTENGVKFFLEWYARLYLGKKILKCIKDTGQCSFEAEL
jgi:hypothetical protein|tara:strand:+ start:288 stop:689 length:402 start_codon:yes stop_codon:yes gene_type:complete